jgi:hypothetical protein
MGTSNYASDTFVAHAMSKLKHLTIICLAEAFPNADVA